MPLHMRMSARDPNEPHRAVTPLELFLDLTFVVAVGQAASSLHHGLVEGNAHDALVAFPVRSTIRTSRSSLRATW